MNKYDKSVKLMQNEIFTLGRFLYLYNTYLHKKIIACKHGYKKLTLEYNDKYLMYKNIYDTFLQEILNKYNIENIDVESIYLSLEESEMQYNETK